MLVHAESRSLLLRAKTPQIIRGLIPKARDIQYEGHNIAVRHGLDEVKVLRNIGVNAPPPILYYYDWPGKYPHVLEHQKQTAAFMTLYHRAFCFNEPGTMKTASVLWAADYLMSLGLIRRCLIVAPNTTLDITWMEEVFACLMHRRAVTLVGSRARREDMLATDSHFYIINHHGLETVADALRGRKDIDLVIGDECDVWCNASTGLYKTMEEVTRTRKTWLLSGTPCPNAPTDAWAITRLINKNRVPQYFGQWRRQTMYQVSTYKWIPRPNAYELAYQAMQPAIRYLKADCLDLPPTVVTRRQVELTPQQKKALTQMKNEAVMDAAAGIQITAVNAADKINKMRQVLCIAAGTPVLTSAGWLPIERVTTLDLLWDGEAWVEHAGLVDKGVQKIIECDGVWMTPDHEILTNIGWRTAHEQSCVRFDRMPVRLPDSIEAPRYLNGGCSTSGALEVSMPVRKDSGSSEPKFTQQPPPECETLRLPQYYDQLEAWHELHPAVPNLDAYETPLRRPQFQGLQKLRRAWHSCMQTVGWFVQGFLAGYAKGVRSPSDTGSYQQRRQLHPKKLPVGHTQATGQQQAPTQQVVYDIVNCGPRNRFVVRGSGGELLIVHNCGVVKDTETGEYVEMPHQPRVDALLHAVAHASTKVIVIVPFKGIIESLAKKIAQHYSVEVINGDVTRTERTAILKRFKNTPDPYVLLCHPRVMAHGLNLAESATLVFYAPIYSNRDFMQVKERIARPGQTHNMTLVRMGAHPLEWEIYGIIDQRGVTQNNILSLYKHQLLGTD